MDVIAELNGLAGQVRPADPRSADRLEQLAQIIGDPDLGNRAAAVDLYGAFDPESVEKSVFAANLNRPHWLSIVEWIRNFLVLAPICLTWLGLWQASVNYQKLISVKPDLITQPFLLLWEQGFAELGPATNLIEKMLRIKFSHVASWDFGLLSAVLLLTVLIYFYRDIWEARAARNAHKLRQHLEGALWEVGRLLAENRYKQNPSAAIVQVAASATKLAQYLEKVNLADLGGKMDTAAGKLQKFSEGVQQVYEPLQRSISGLSSQVKIVGEQQDRLVTTMTGLDGQMKGLMDTTKKAGDCLEKAAKEVAASAGQVAASVGQIADYTNGAAAQFKSICDLLDDMTQRQDKITENLRCATDRSRKAAEQWEKSATSLNNAGSHLAPTLQNFSQQMEQLTETVSDLKRTAGRGPLSRSLADWLFMASIWGMMTIVAFLLAVQTLGIFK